MAQERTRIVAGCMTGTSLDGLDVALVKIIGKGLDMKAELIAHHAVGMPDRLRSMLMSFAEGGAAEPVEFMRAARALGRLHLEGLQTLLAGGLVPPLGLPGSLDFVTAHGQTIWHAPSDAPRYDAAAGPKSWQLFDPWPVVQGLKVPVCYDLRQADLIAGGEGAPLTPVADWVMYRKKADVVFNLGGVLNFTQWWSEEPELEDIEGGDFTYCNLLLDGLASRLLDQKYDVDGAVAAQGVQHESLYRDLEQRLPADVGTLGREGVAQLIDQILQAHPDQSPANLLHNASCFIAGCIAAVMEGAGASAVLLAGGGARNKTLVNITRSLVEAQGFEEQLLLSDDLGIPCEAREAMGFAVLGALSQDGVPISLPQVTGATDPGVAGVWAYP